MSSIRYRDCEASSKTTSVSKAAALLTSSTLLQVSHPVGIQTHNLPSLRKGLRKKNNKKTRACFRLLTQLKSGQVRSEMASTATVSTELHGVMTFIKERLSNMKTLAATAGVSEKHANAVRDAVLRAYSRVCHRELSEFEKYNELPYKYEAAQTVAEEIKRVTDNLPKTTRSPLQSLGLKHTVAAQLESLAKQSRDLVRNHAANIKKSTLSQYGSKGKEYRWGGAIRAAGILLSLNSIPDKRAKKLSAALTKRLLDIREAHGRNVNTVNVLSHILRGYSTALQTKNPELATECANLKIWSSEVEHILNHLREELNSKLAGCNPVVRSAFSVPAPTPLAVSETGLWEGNAFAVLLKRLQLYADQPLPAVEESLEFLLTADGNELTKAAQNVAMDVQNKGMMTSSASQSNPQASSSSTQGEPPATATDGPFDKFVRNLLDSKSSQTIKVHSCDADGKMTKKLVPQKFPGSFISAMGAHLEEKFLDVVPL